MMFVQCMTKIIVIFCFNQHERSNHIIGVLMMGIFSIKILALAYFTSNSTRARLSSDDGHLRRKLDER